MLGYDVFGIYGCGGYGREVLPILREEMLLTGKNPKNLYFISDFEGDRGKFINGHEVVGLDDFIKLQGDKHKVSISVADYKARKELTQKCLNLDIDVYSIKARNIEIMDNVIIGKGSILSPFVTITSDVKIGDGFHANIYSYVAHDCVIGDFVTFAPAVKCNGNVHIGNNVYIGTGAIIKQGKSSSRPLVIEDNAKIGAGSFVTKNVLEGTTVFGAPAKKIR